MKSFSYSYFEDIIEAFKEGSASLNGWAINRIKEVKDSLIEGDSIEIRIGNEKVVISSIDELVKWKRGKTIESISFK